MRCGFHDARAQTALPALAVSLLLLTMVTGLSLAMADGALESGDREPAERRVASSLAHRLVASESLLTERANVLNASELAAMDESTLEREYPVVRGTDVRLRVNGSTVAESGDVSGGTTIRRLVLIQRAQSRTIRPTLGPNRIVTIPRRTEQITLELSPPTGTTVTTVRANERVVLRNSSGLVGEFDVSLSRLETTRIRFGGSGPLPPGSVTIRYAAPRTTKTKLAVTADG